MAATKRPGLNGWARLCVTIAVAVATFGAVLSTGACSHFGKWV